MRRSLIVIIIVVIIVIIIVIITITIIVIITIIIVVIVIIISRRPRVDVAAQRMPWPGPQHLGVWCLGVGVKGLGSRVWG